MAVADGRAAHQRAHGVGNLPLLEVDSGQSIRCVIANDLIDRALENSLNRTTRTMVHPVTQLEVAERKLSIINVKIEGVALGFV